MKYYAVGCIHSDGKESVRCVPAENKVHACRMFLLEELEFSPETTPKFNSVRMYKKFMLSILGHKMTSPVQVHDTHVQYSMHILKGNNILKVHGSRHGRCRKRK